VPQEAAQVAGEVAVKETLPLVATLGFCGEMVKVGVPGPTIVAVVDTVWALPVGGGGAATVMTHEAAEAGAV
jgi:hypothetical protein